MTSSSELTAVAGLRLPTRSEIEQLAEALGVRAQVGLSLPPVPTAAPLPPPPFKQELDGDALYGLAGRILRVLTPHSEAHPAAILLQFLTAFGNVVGRGPHCMVESTRHGLNLFTILVGDSSKGRKGTSWNLIANLFAGVDQSWLSTRVNSARLTAFGVVNVLRDQEPPTDRRLLLLSEEFAGVLRSFGHGTGHLGPLLRGAWDSGDLPTVDMRQNLRATNTHVSLVAHISRHELAQMLHRTGAHNGFANRCLWTWVERANCLPHATSPPSDQLAAACDEIRRAVAWATDRPEILFRRDEAADKLWAQYYPALSYHRPGLRGAATSRAEAQVLRLSAIYAALDCSQIIERPHLQAAIALWTYCYVSATRLFGMSTGDPIADRIYEAIHDSDNGLSRKQIRAIFQGHVDSERIDEALNQLASLEAITGQIFSTPGRPTTVWSLTEAQPSEGIAQPPQSEEWD